jgi:hypothetical protein
MEATDKGGAPMGYEAIGTVQETGAEVKHRKSRRPRRDAFAFSDGTCLFCEDCLQSTASSATSTSAAPAEGARSVRPLMPGRVRTLGDGVADLHPAVRPGNRARAGAGGQRRSQSGGLRPRRGVVAELVDRVFVGFGVAGGEEGSRRGRPVVLTKGLMLVPGTTFVRDTADPLTPQLMPGPGL